MEIENEASDTGFDLDASFDAVSKELATEPGAAEAGAEASAEGKEQEGQEAEASAENDAVAMAAAANAANTPREPPKSWSKEYHDEWAKLTPRVQDYYIQREKQMLDGLDQYKNDATMARQFKEILTPYAPMLQSMGLKEADAVKTLLNAQYQLTHGTEAERRSAYEKIGRSLGLTPAQAATMEGGPEKALQERLDRIESALTADRQRALQAAQAEAASKVEKFAADPAHPYANELWDDILPFVRSGMDLEAAYERAVWANPVTRAKEQARIQTESEAKRLAKAKEEADKARKATSANVRGAESRKAPTEPKGKMFDDMPDLLAEIKARAN